MKYKGKKIEGKNIEIIPFNRPGGDIVFIAEAISDFDEFEKLCPEPQPPEKMIKGGVKVKDTKNPSYLKALDIYAEQRINYIIITSLRATKDLQWETINYEKPETWSNFKQEFTDAGFTDIEQGRILRGVMKANSLDEDMIETARQDFLAGLGAEEEK